MSCPLDYQLSVTSAFYGRDDNVTCDSTSDVSFSNHSTSELCDVSGTLEIMRSRCDGRRECVVQTDAATLDPLDECPDVFKFLRVSFLCVRKSHDRPLVTSIILQASCKRCLPSLENNAIKQNRLTLLNLRKQKIITCVFVWMK